jgi:hypothetical protein
LKILDLRSYPSIRYIENYNCDIDEENFKNLEELILFGEALEGIDILFMKHNFPSLRILRIDHDLKIKKEYKIYTKLESIFVYLGTENLNRKPKVFKMDESIKFVIHYPTEKYS